MSNGTARPDPRQFPINMATHRIADRFYTLRDFFFATFTQAGCIGRKRCQRRFEAVGEICCSPTRSLNLLFLHIQ